MNNNFISILSFILPLVENDAPVPWQMSFQEACMEQ